LYEKWKSRWSRCLVSLVGGLLCFQTVLLATDGGAGIQAKGDLALFTFQAKIHGGDARAICLKRDIIDLKAFCYYYYPGPGSGLLQRSDDSNFSAVPRVIQGDQDDALGRWLKTVDIRYGIDQNTVKSLLGRLRSGQTAASQLQGLLSQSKGSWAAALNPADQNLGPLSDAAAFHSRIAESLAAPKSVAVSTTMVSPPAPVRAGGSLEVLRAAEAFITSMNEFLVRARTLNDLEARSARTNSLLYTLLGVGILIIALILFLIITPRHRVTAIQSTDSTYETIYLRLRQSAGASDAEAALDRILEEHNPDNLDRTDQVPSSPLKQFGSAATTEGGFWSWLRKKRQPEGGSAPALNPMEALQSFHKAVRDFRVERLLATTPANQEAEEAQAVLAEVLEVEGRSGEGLLGKARAVATLLQELRARVAEIALLPATTSLTSGIETVNTNLEGLSTSFSDFAKRVIVLAEPLAEDKISLRDVSPGAGGQALDIIENHLSDYSDALKAIEKLSYSRAALPNSLEDYGRILSDLRRRFGVHTPKAVVEDVEAFWKLLWASVSDLPAGLTESSSPKTLLDALVNELRTCRGERNRLSERLDQQQTSLDELARVEKGLVTVRIPDESAINCVQRIVNENREASEILEATGDGEPGLLGRARSASRLLREVKQKVHTVLPDSNGALNIAISQLADEVTALRASRRPQVELIEELCRSVRFNVEDIGNPVCLKGLLGAVQLEATGPHRQLRLGLCAALTMWDTAVLQLRQNGRQDVVSALQLKAIRDALPTILGLMQNRQTEELLDRCLAEGFAKNGFHHLFRAETLLNTYFSGLPVFDGIREWAALAGAAVRAALRRLDCEVQMIPLLQPIPRLPADRLEVSPEASPELRQVKEVWERVNELLARREHADAVVDVQLFVRREHGQLKGTCRVITLNPSEWRTFEGAMS
jgi:hypothetical protein